MAHENEQYLSDKETVDKIYGFLQNGQTDSAAAFIKGLGDDNVVVQTWISVQCDINNIKHDPKASAEIGNAGIFYCLEKGYKLPAAMMLHNVTSFYMPDFDEGIKPEAIPIIVQAAIRQVELRREIGDPGPLMWALWDQGVAELAAGNAAEALFILNEGRKIADEQKDRDGAAWCLLFIGKTKIRLMPDLREEGEKDIRLAAEIIDEVGQDWEKDAVVNILKSVGVE